MSDNSILIQIGADTFYQLGFETIVPRDGKAYNVIAGKHERSVKFVEANNSEVANIVTISERLANLEQQVANVKYGTDKQDITGQTNVDKKGASYVASGTITADTKVTVKDAILSNITTTDSSLIVNATEDIIVKGYELKGEVPKSKTNASIQLHADGYVTIRDSVIESTGYNAIEIGLSTGLAKSVVIDNVDFRGTFDNNAINVFGMAEGGVITISNCHFGKVSNALRISNRENTHFTVNFINCTIDAWDERPEFRGAVIFQDYNSGSAEAADTNDQFSKVTLNIQNLIQPDGTIFRPTNLAEVCGTVDDNQVIYLWDNWRQTTVYGDKYPTITVK